MATPTGRVSPAADGTGNTVKLQHGKKLKCVCAATLVYEVAPYPMSNDVVFDMAILDQADRVRESASSQGWLARAWGGVKGFMQNQVVAQRQASFIQHFARQLELNADESHTVMVSARCAVLSMGVPQCGMLFATNYGLYFCADGVAALEDKVVEPDVQHGWDDASTGSSVESLVVDEVLLEGREFIKDRIPLADIASILPSVVLPTRGGGAPFLQGIPSVTVCPTALQLFMADSSRQLFQFLGINDIVVKPPGVVFNNSGNSGAKSEAPTPVVEVVRASEMELLAGFPSQLATLQFTALLERLWRKRLECLGMPLCNPNVTYAAPH